MKTRILAMLMALAMIIGMVPMTALATEEKGPEAHFAFNGPHNHNKPTFPENPVKPEKPVAPEKPEIPEETECKHAWQVMAEVTPDCLYGGSKQSMCTVCGEWKTEELPVNPSNHNPNCDHATECAHEWQVMSEVTPDCLYAGTKQSMCTKCNEWKTEELPVDPSNHNPNCDHATECAHEWQVMSEVTPDCLYAGTKQSMCTKCNEWKTEELPVDPSNHNPNCDHVTECAHEWQLMAEVTPDCLYGGSKQYWCALCNEWKTEELSVDPSNHNPNCDHVTECAHEWQVMAEVTPDCLYGGSKQYWCSLCNEWKTEELPIDPSNHNPNCDHNAQPEKPVKPNRPGKPNKPVKPSKPAKPECKHTWQVMAEVTPDCLYSGSKQSMCTKCGEWKTEELPADPSNHNPNCDHKVETEEPEVEESVPTVPAKPAKSSFHKLIALFKALFRH